MDGLWFFVEALVGGLLSGVMYTLVALGFVLIYKASGVFNFAQGAMVLFAALTFVGFVELGLPFWMALAAALGVMMLLAVGIERVVLRPLVGQPPIILFMATIGLSIFLEGFAQAVWGSQVRALDLGIPDMPMEIDRVLISRFDLTAAVIAAGLVIALSLFFSHTRMGRALRAVADDSQAAQVAGVPLNLIWAVVWGAAGLVALVAGLVWGARLGVQFSLTLIALKALPVLILGGFDSVAGAIVGGLIIGASEKLAEIYVGALIGGGIENWFPYALAIAFLLVRPGGLFGGKRVMRV
ncbi:branched-chain amino acid ABC transporter permease [Azospirillum sp. RWY-5-1]|uniref:Branched-chain amino acid ABC transporter permease n=1 Tax=Azospirillum oleiclasticum TaxID=2735135 RepID=A0ABX2TG80_9PROT|nr:branched-chain amino acid ABC transporter permease [Azospirillum oleiclasticum]NYZ14412.1 branched-chain amino acid ABC transporter permease [Azospirillum oleiclasticum]NYZ23236.1 branched-chain amino acid ABC transporter permease [Azospirillum oleiclasticum]